MLPKLSSWNLKLCSTSLVVSWIIPAVSSAWWPFNPQRFTGNGLLEAGALGIDKDARIIAFGDFDGDQL
jgi:integrin alpha FG-GAP repeat containing protein 1